MDKSEKLEAIRQIQIPMYNLYEIPKANGRSIREHAQKQGYHYLRISVDDVETGEKVIRPIFTIRKPDDLQLLFNQLLDVADWPRDFLAQLYTPAYVDGEVWVDKTKTALQIHDKQLLGGRKKQDGYSEEIKERLYEIAVEFYKSGMERQDFLKEHNVSSSTLKRATRFYKENPKYK